MIRTLLAAALFAASLATASAQVVQPGQPQNSDQLTGPAKAGRFYGAQTSASPTANAVASANRLTAIPVFIGAGSVLKTLNFNITTGNAAAWNARVCLYADNGSGLPGALVPGTDAGTIGVGSGSVVGVQTSTLGAGISLGGPAWYWAAFMADSASESLSSIGNGAGGFLTSSKQLGSNSIANFVGAAPAPGVFMAQTFGACPASFGAVTYGDSTAIPYVFLGF